MKRKLKLVALGFVLGGGLTVGSAWAQETELEKTILEKLDAIEEKQFEILDRMKSIEAAQNEQKEILADIAKKQKSYVNPKWTP